VPETPSFGTTQIRDSHPVGILKHHVSLPSRRRGEIFLKFQSEWRSIRDVTESAVVAAELHIFLLPLLAPEAASLCTQIRRRHKHKEYGQPYRNEQPNACKYVVCSRVCLANFHPDAFRCSLRKHSAERKKITLAAPIVMTDKSPPCDFLENEGGKFQEHIVSEKPMQTIPGNSLRGCATIELNNALFATLGAT